MCCILLLLIVLYLGQIVKVCVFIHLTLSYKHYDQCAFMILAKVIAVNFSGIINKYINIIYQTIQHTLLGNKTTSTDPSHLYGGQFVHSHMPYIFCWQ